MSAPLAFRMRPQTIADIVGQQHLVGKDKIINRMVKAKRLTSMILYGPPGIGKTSIASAIAGSTKYAFRQLNAATDGKKELKIVAEEAKMSGAVVLLLDEIHRLDKTKQDFLLPMLESGKIILIGATTENPYISISPAIRSRTEIFELYPLSSDDISQAINRALSDQTNGLGKYHVELTDEARELLITRSNGDLRNALNGLELAVLSSYQEESDQLTINEAIIKDSIQKQNISADKNGDSHYNLLSAFQKSIRGSDTDAALHYLARLILSGDLPSIIRRLTVIVFEDIGLANPQAWLHTMTAIEAAEKVGFPEARIPLSNAVIELCLSPKSNSSLAAIDQALSDIQTKRISDIPSHIKDAHYSGAEKLGSGVGYLYPHDFENDFIAQDYLPNSLKNAHYFKPKGNSKFEISFKNQYQKLKDLQRKGRR
ncbi:replication-associated recombination protein A [Holzapfeliella sp. He02]|uniref:Replication-associated recombination protein A n=1 Tax=Holzapfeliella saturejae TaxID=3082953 RepID=A0ABU8SHA6_9LACO